MAEGVTLTATPTLLVVLGMGARVGAVLLTITLAERKVATAICRDDHISGISRACGPRSEAPTQENPL